MATVALLGFAERTRYAIKDSSADEIWTLNWGYNYDFVPRIDRLFEMHPIWAFGGSDKGPYENPRRHWEWLQTGAADYPVYMLRKLPIVPQSVSYPIDEVTQYLFGGRLLRGENPVSFFTSSFDYMIALAIYEQFDVIELYGFEMGSSTEYRYQRDGGHFFIGQALAKGITVKLQQNSILVKAKNYGYSGGQMIFRQDLEAFKTYYANKQREALGRLQYLEGQYREMNENGSAPEEKKIELRKARDMAAVYAGAYQTVCFMIQEVDLEEPDLEINYPFELASPELQAPQS